MLKKTITYNDYNGTERTEDFYFNLTEAEVMEMQMSTKGGLTEYIQRIIAAQDTPTLVKLFKDIIKQAYGVKSLDGRRIVKNDDVFEEFSQTNAYSKLFMELSTDAQAASDFINGIAPAAPKQNVPAPALAPVH